MSMQLIEEVPAMLALFMCGVAGYLVTKWFGRPLIPDAKSSLRSKVLEEIEEIVCVQSAEPTESKEELPSQAKRRMRRRQGAAGAIASSPVAAPSAVATAPAAAHAPCAAAAEEEAPAPPVSDRVARLLAKKAERKARKAAALLRIEQEVASAAVAVDAPASIEEEAGSACTTPSCVPLASSLESFSQAEVTSSVEADSEPMEEAEDVSSLSPVVGEHQEEPADAKSCTKPITESPCLDFEDWASEDTASEAPWSWPEEPESSSSDDVQQWVPTYKSSAAYDRWPRQACHNEDGWMKSFDDHIGKSCAWPASPAVCLWKGHSTADATSGEGPFTDGQRFYQALQSSCGQQYYTDGESLFLPVCVVVPDAAPVVDLLDPLAAAPMCPQQALHEQADMEAFDPYDPLGIAGLEKQRSATKREDAWNTTWG